MQLEEKKFKTVALTGTDFSKSFSRYSHQEILAPYNKLGLSDWGIRMHAAFLANRRMRVKIRNVLSEEKPVTGGAVQASVLCVLDHNAVLKFIYEDIDQEIYKYINDLTLSEEIPEDIDLLVDNTGGIQTHHFRPENTQNRFNKIYEACEQRKLKINEKKLSCYRFQITHMRLKPG